MVVAMRSAAYEPSDIFTRALTGLGARVHRVDGARDAAELVDGLARKQSDPPAVLWEPHDLLENIGLRRALNARGVRVVDVADAGSKAADHRVGITAAELAIAGSGTLLVGGEPGGWGLAASLPWMHIAFVAEGDIEPDLAAAFGRFREAFDAGHRNWVW
ncbi:MAG: hypothetical protein GWN53_00320, partial [Gammaproteobacteria bacterium]|nr:hypothetical protein [Gammaproteobacteria bacterium]